MAPLSSRDDTVDEDHHLPDEAVRITMIGHSTCLLNVGETTILTDPYFGVGGNLAYRRVAPPAIGRADVPVVDLVLVSHNHWDHTDRRYFRRLPADTPILAPRGATWITRLKGAKNVVGVGPWESTAVGATSVTAVPASHAAKTIGFVIRTHRHQIYFAGDTYRRPFMCEIGSTYDLDVAMLPVTTYRIPMTMGEKSAVAAVRDLQPSVVIPIHLGIEPRAPWLRTGQTAQSFARRLATAGIDAEAVMLRAGESWTSP